MERVDPARRFQRTGVPCSPIPRFPISTQSTIAGIRPFAELARGAAAVVYKGYDPGRGVVLLKVLTAEAAEDPALVAWLEQEAAAVASVAHPNVVALYASGRDAGRPYLVVEFVEGLSLDAALAAHGALPPELAAYVAAETARGLGAAHAAGVLHRDLKPANVLLGYDGQVKLTDFGLATRIDAAGGTDGAAEVRGTLGYLAPETVRGEAAGPAADLFALGATLAEMLTGRPAFPAAGASAALDAALHHDPLPPLRADPRLSAGLVDVAQQLLDRDCAARPAEADAVATVLDAYRAIPGTDHRADAEALAAFLADPDAYRAARPVTPSLLVPGVVPAPGAPLVEALRSPASAPRPRRRRVGRVAGAMLVLAAAAALVLAVHSVTRAPAGPDDALVEAGSLRPNPVAETGPPDSLVAMAGPPESDAPEDESEEDPPEEPEEEPAPEEDTEAATVTPSATSGSTDAPAEAAPPATGALVVVVQPWAEISVDGRVVLREGSLAEVEGLAAGPHRVVLRHPDFPEYATTVTVRDGEPVRLPVSLWSLVERVTLRVHPYAEVYVDGRLFGTIPPQRRPLLLTPGAHTLRLVHPSLGTWTAQVGAQAGRERTLSYNLPQLLGAEQIP